MTPGQGGFLTAPSRGDGFYGFNTAGNREDTINFLVNGVTINEQFNGLPLLTTVSTAQELKVDNSTFSAEYGRKSGAVVSIVTRSGTNALRGDLYEFFRDDALDARNFFSQRAEPQLYRRHQFGASIGGPLIRNRAFVFATYEGQRQQQGLDVNSLVLSDAERAAARVPQVTELLRFIPQANLVDAGGTSRFLGSATAPFESNAWSLDLTVVPPANRRVQGYYADVRDQRAEPLLQGNTIPGFGDIRQRHRHVFTLNDVSVLRPTLVNEARLGFLRSVGVAAPAQLLNPTDLRIRVGSDDAVGLPQISVGGGLNFGGPANTLTGRQGTTLVVSDTISYQRDRHSLRMGGDYRWYNSQGYTRDSGRLNFPTVADFIAGAANAFSITLGDRRADVSQNTVGLFAQDQLRLRQNLTLELGLRADWTMAPTERDDRFVVFDPSTVSLLRVGTDMDKVYDNRLNLQPRVGMAWDPLGEGGAVVRAAYGVYTNQPPINMVLGATTNPPLVTPLSYSGLIGLDNAIDLARATGLAPSTVDSNFEPATTQSWNVNLQREVARNVALMVGYFGAKGSNLQIATNVNQPIDGARPFPRLSSRVLKTAGYVVRVYSTGAEFLAQLPTEAGCLVLDLHLPGPSGLDLQQRLTTAENPLPIVFLTGHGDVPKFVRAMKAGAVDFLTKPVEAPVLLDAVARAIARDAENRVVRARQHEARARYSRLTPRERDVFAHLISGQLNKQIGYDLGISERTTKIHRRQVLEKMQADSIADLVRTAADLGIAAVGKVR